MILLSPILGQNVRIADVTRVFIVGTYMVLRTIERSEEHEEAVRCVIR